MQSFRSAILLAASGFVAGPLFAQPAGLAFTRLSPQGPAPSPRLDAPIAYDVPGRQLIVFGGQDAGGDRNDLWTFSVESKQWRELNPSGSRPAARHGHSLIFDPVRRRVILFGGQADRFFADTWAYEIAANSWRQLSPSGPAERYGHSAIYDPRGDRMIISHGFTSVQGRFDDTWAFDLRDNTWRNITPGGPRPLRRCLHHAVYDERNHQMLLYGGCSGGFGPCPQGDLWSFDLNTNHWVERTSNPRPPVRERYGMAFDTNRNRLALFGGYGRDGGGPLNDTWEYDPAGDAWTQVTPQGDAPEARARHESAFAADLGAVFFFGGEARGLTNELLMLGPPPPPRVQIAPLGITNVFSGRGDAIAPGEIVAIYGSGLGPEIGVSAGFDPATGALPTTAAGVSVSVNGFPAPIYFVRSDQVNVQIPYEVAGQTVALIAVTYNRETSSVARVPLADSAPGLFPRGIHEDGTFNSTENPAPPGGILILYATGHGVTTPASSTGEPPGGDLPVPAAPVALMIGGRSAELLYAGQAPGLVGLMQINARAPVGLPAAAAVPVVLRIGAFQSQDGVTIAVR